MPSCGSPARSYGRDGGWCTGCCRGTSTCRSSSAWSIGCGDEEGTHEVGVRMRRSVEAPGATPQEGQPSMAKPTGAVKPLLPREQNRESPYPLAGPETDRKSTRLNS